MCELPEFESIQRCPKCGEDRENMLIRYYSGHAGSGRLWWREPPEEAHMQIICGRCDYYWRERPLDSGSKSNG